jgi:hypothetical protein
VKNGWCGTGDFTAVPRPGGSQNSVSVCTLKSATAGLDVRLDFGGFGR